MWISLPRVQQGHSCRDPSLVPSRVCIVRALESGAVSTVTQAIRGGKQCPQQWFMGQPSLHPQRRLLESDFILFFPQCFQPSTIESHGPVNQVSCPYSGRQGSAEPLACLSTCLPALSLGLPGPARAQHPTISPASYLVRSPFKFFLCVAS